MHNLTLQITVDANMDTEEYLISTIEKLNIGVHCKDVRNVYCQEMKITKLFYQSDIYHGITTINENIVHIIDFGKRIGVPSNSYSGTIHKNVIVFQTKIEQQVALIVDNIIGLKSIRHADISKSSDNFNNHQQNINLLFPNIAKMDDGSLIYLMDATYLENTQPIPEESGDLEFF